jgi:hypothetical protein
MTPEELIILTDAIDTYNYHNEDMITPQSLHAKLWPGLQQLRQAPNKAALIADWKYKKELESAEVSHANNANKHMHLDDWEQRFVVDFWLSIYH